MSLESGEQVATVYGCGFELSLICKEKPQPEQPSHGLPKSTVDEGSTVGNTLKEYVLLDTKGNTAKLKLRIHLLYY